MAAGVPKPTVFDTRYSQQSRVITGTSSLYSVALRNLSGTGTPRAAVPFRFSRFNIESSELLWTGRMQSLVLTLLSCAQRPSNWEAALNDFADTFDLYASVLFKIHDFQSNRGDFIWSDRIRKAMPEAVQRQVEEGRDIDDHQAFARLLQQPPLVPHDELKLFGVRSSEDLPPSDVRASAEGLGIKVRVGTVLNRSGPWADCLVSHTLREEDHRHFCEDPNVRTMMSVLSGTVTLGRMFEELKQRYGVALAALSRLGIGVFILDGAGTVVEHNGEAQAILDQGDGLSIARSGVLQIVEADAQMAFKHAINAQSDFLPSRSHAKLRMVSAPRRSGAFDYLISVRALYDLDGELANRFTGLFVTVIDPGRRDVLSADGLSTLGDLTKTETHITQLLVDGFKISEISEYRGISTETVRGHVKSVLQKLRCNSQSDVIRAAAATRLPFVSEEPPKES